MRLDVATKGRERLMKKVGRRPFLYVPFFYVLGLYWMLWLNVGVLRLDAENSRLRYENCDRRLDTYLKEKEVDSLRPWSITVSEADYEQITEFLRSELEQRNQE